MKKILLILIFLAICLLGGNAYALFAETTTHLSNHIAESMQMAMVGVGLFLLAQIIRKQQRNGLPSNPSRRIETQQAIDK